MTIIHVKPSNDAYISLLNSNTNDYCTIKLNDY